MFILEIVITSTFTHCLSEESHFLSAPTQDTLQDSYDSGDAFSLISNNASRMESFSFLQAPLEDKSELKVSPSSPIEVEKI